MTLDLQQLIKFPVGASFQSFEMVQSSSPAMHMRQHLASAEQIVEVFLSLSLYKCRPNGGNHAYAKYFQGMLFMPAFFAMTFQTAALKSNYF